MTTSHFKAERIELVGTVARYRYYPDHIAAPTLHGEFEVDSSDWSVRILLHAASDGGTSTLQDKRCVGALVHKLKNAAPPLPLRVYFTA